MSERFTREQPRTAPITSTPILVEIDAEYVPLLFSALEKYHNQYYWRTEEDYAIGYQGIVKLERALLTDMSEPLVNAINRLTRYVDTAFNGTQYVNTPGGVLPAIAEVPPTTPDNDLGGLRRRLLSVQGEIPGGWFGIGARPAELADLLRAGRFNNDEDRQSLDDALGSLDEALDIGTDLGTFLTNLLSGAADLGTDGGVIIAQLVSAAAQARLMQRMIKVLDGGAVIGPSSPTNNLLTYARAAAFDDAREKSAGQLLADIYQRLDDLKQVIVAPGDGPQSLAQRIDRLRLQLSALARLDELDNPVAGAVFAEFNTLLNCICEGVNGPPNAPTFPDPAQPCGSSFPTWALRSDVTLAASTLPGDDVYRGEVTSWTVVDSSATLSWLATPDYDALLVVGGPVSRELCVSYQLPEGATDPGPITINFNPKLIDGGGDANRPYIQTQGSQSDSYEFWPDDGVSGDAIGYYVTLAGPDGVPVTTPVRVNIHAGGLG